MDTLMRNPINEEEEEEEDKVEKEEETKENDQERNNSAANHNQQVWCPDKEECWKLRDVVFIDGLRNVVHVYDDGARPRPNTNTSEEGGLCNTIQFPLQEVHPFDPSHGVNLINIADMNNLHEAPLLDLLRRRYNQDEIYTFTGDILISINPYKNVPFLYKLPESMQSQEIGQDAPPHVYTVAARALHRMIENPLEEQAIIINGESGAGKTEASKHLIRYFGAMSTRGKGAMSGADIYDEELFNRIEEKVLESNYLLEAFGNAKTVRNDNSSRFGKFIELMYKVPLVASDDETYKRKVASATIPKISGGHISYFLLEKSRLVSRSSHERNYHVFYALCDGTSEEERAELGLLAANEYKYLSGTKSGMFVEGRDDAKALESIRRALEFAGVSHEETIKVFRTLVAILSLGNIEVFEKPPPGAEGDESQIAQANAASEAANSFLECDPPESDPENSDPVEDEQERNNNVRRAYVPTDQEALQHAAKLLGIDAEVLCRTLKGRVVVSASARATITRIDLSPEQTEDSINALAKALYSRLFDWMIGRINQTIQGGSRDDVDEEFNPVEFADGSIGILDIYGFEILEKNSFEQLCINFANERLQRQFNSKVFDAEQERYIAEGVEWTHSQYGYDNTSCIELIGGNPLGILPILDEQTLLGHHTAGALGKEGVEQHVDGQFLAKINRAHGGPSGKRARHPNYEKPKIAGTTFIIKHFAGRVEYDGAGFPRKNNDSLHNDLLLLLHNAKDPFVKDLFRPDVELMMEEETMLKEQKKTDGQPAREWNNKLIRRRSSNSSMFKAAAEKDDESASINAKNAVSSVIGAPTSKMHKGGGRIFSKSMAAKRTVGFRFRKQLDVLMALLEKAYPHYIRCVKPNALKFPGGIDSPLVLEQLRYIGVLETVRIRRDGYPVRLSFQDFLAMYAPLMRKKPNTNDESSEFEDEEDRLRQQVRAVLEDVLEDGDWQMGNTCVFLRDRQTEVLDAEMRQLQGSSAALIQARIRAILAKKRLEQERKRNIATLRLQAMVRMIKPKREFQEQRLAISRVQAVVRCYKARCEYTKHAKSASIMQKWARRAVAMKRERAALNIQRFARVVIAKRRVRLEVERIHADEIQAEKENKASAAIQAIARRVLQEKRGQKPVDKCRAAAKRLQRAIRAMLLNKSLEHIIDRLHALAKAGDIDTLAELCTQAVESNPACFGVRNRKMNFRTLLHSAAESASVDCCKYLLERTSPGFKVQGCELHDAVDVLGNTPLHIAAGRNGQVHLSVIKTLLESSTRSAIDLGVINMPTGTPSETINGSKTSNVLEGDLLKRKPNSVFHKRHVVLDKKAGTLTYMKRESDQKVRCTINLAEGCGAMLKVSERFHNCFEIHSHELFDVCREGRLYFKCNSQQELQKWVGAIRDVTGVIFASYLSRLQYVSKNLMCSDWDKIRQALFRTNNNKETVLHCTAQGAGESRLVLWYVAMLCGQGPDVISEFLNLKTGENKEAMALAEKNGHTEMVSMIKTILSNLSKPQKLIAPPKFDIPKKNTHFSLYILTVGVDNAEELIDPTLWISVATTRSRLKGPVPQVPSKPSFKKGGKNIVRESQLVEPQCKFPALRNHCQSVDGNQLYIGATWHMQTPLEQLTKGANVIMELKHDGNKKTLCKAIIPIDARSLKDRQLISGEQSFPMTLPQSHKPQARALELVRTLSTLSTFSHATNGKSHDDDIEDTYFLRGDVHFSRSLQPQANIPNLLNNL